MHFFLAGRDFIVPKGQNGWPNIKAPVLIYDEHGEFFHRFSGNEEESIGIEIGPKNIGKSMRFSFIARNRTTKFPISLKIEVFQFGRSEWRKVANARNFDLQIDREFSESEKILVKLKSLIPEHPTRIMISRLPNGPAGFFDLIGVNID